MTVPKFSKRTFRLVSATSTASGAFSLGQKYGKIHAFHVQSYKSSAKAATGVDTAIGFKISDANGVVIFDTGATGAENVVAGKAYLPNIGSITGPTGTPVQYDATAHTGVTASPVNGWICASPCRVDLVNAGTTADFFEFLFYVEV